jgi:hypothetical protein
MSKNVRSRRRRANINDENPTPSAQPTKRHACARDGAELVEDERETSEQLSEAQELDGGHTDEPDPENLAGGPHTPPPPANQNDSKDAPDCSPKELRKWRAWIMHLAGVRQKDIAKELKVTTRTIRIWLKEFEGKTTGLIENLDAEGEVVRHLLRLSMRENKYREYQKNAELRGDDRTAIRCETLIGRLDDERHRYLTKIGLFNGLNLAQLVKAASGDRETASIHDMIEEVIAGIKDVPDGDPSEDE